MDKNVYKQAYIWSSGSCDSLWILHKSDYLNSVIRAKRGINKVDKRFTWPLNWAFVFPIRPFEEFNYELCSPRH